jgi:hypothetical protein
MVITGTAETVSGDASVPLLTIEQDGLCRLEASVDESKR